MKAVDIGMLVFYACASLAMLMVAYTSWRQNRRMKQDQKLNQAHAEQSQAKMMEFLNINLERAKAELQKTLGKEPWE